MSGRPAGGGAGRVSLAWRRLRRNPVAMASALVLVLILFVCIPGAPLWVHVVAHHGPERPEHLGLRARGRQEGAGRRPRRHADRPRAARPATCSAPTRTAATCSCACSTADAPRCSSGSLSALLCVALALVLALVAGTLGGRHRRADLARARPDLVVPGLPARGRARHRVRGGRARHRARCTSPRRSTGHPDRGDRDRLRPLRGATDPRPGAVAAAPGVRRGRGRARCRHAAGDGARAAAQRLSIGAGASSR